MEKVDLSANARHWDEALSPHGITTSSPMCLLAFFATSDGIVLETSPPASCPIGAMHRIDAGERSHGCHRKPRGVVGKKMTLSCGPQLLGRCNSPCI
jgi:hypothetical protein